MTIVNRIMFFVDGENLVMRYQAMKEQGWIPNPGIIHEPDIFVWHSNIINDYVANVMRVTYYTSAVAADDEIQTLAARIQQIKCSYQDLSIRVERELYPHIFKKLKKTHKSRAVDINITIDALVQAFNSTVDVICLITGDGDFLPLIKEVIRSGKQAYIWALSDGLNPQLPIVADSFKYLDNALFQPQKSP
jgi:uncharacterized LabA/DUF88 family protein